jgi:phosphate transport system substrate-binding protein
LDFFKWALESGQTQAETLNYVPLPSTLVQQIKTYWKAQSAWKG